MKDCKNISVRILTSCYSWLGGAIVEPITAKLLLTIVSSAYSKELSSEMQYKIRETVFKTQMHPETLPEIRQELLCLLIVIPPERREMHILEGLISLWCS